MERRMKLAGFGGQGVMLVGKILGYAASDHNKYATFLPSYGTQQRGGTAMCTVVVSDEEVGSPVVGHPDTMLIFNQASMDAYEDQIQTGGWVFMNSNATEPPKRTDLNVVAIPIDDMARDMGNRKVSNLIMLGAFCQKTGLFTQEEIIHTMHHVLGGKPELMAQNEAAIRAGADFIAAQQ
ncbi:MAG: 2-oxoacid:acceptor oxidoreductase family protein [Firmicutes bacterium]|nr:2-oxoacid:acceptor oxidoreductase family protein [Bacillota bacterium]